MKFFARNQKSRQLWRALVFMAAILGLMAPGCGGPTMTDTAPESSEADANQPAQDEMAADPESTSAAVGPEAPLPPVTEIDAAKLGEILAANEGKITVLNIWATWCGPCVYEMPDLAAFYNESDRENIAFVSLSVDAVPEMESAIPEFQRDHSVPFPIYVLSGRDDEGMLKALKTEFEGAIPATFLYRKDGSLGATKVGAVTKEKLREMIANL